MTRDFCLGATTLSGGNGGIGRVARMSAQALFDAGHTLDMITLLDKGPLDFAGQRVIATDNNKIAFALRCHLAALRQPLFLYDSAGPARAHPFLPGLKRPYAIWIHGIEVWGPNLRADYAKVVKGADLVLVNSHFTLEHAQKAMGSLPQAKVCWLATEQDAESTRQIDPEAPPSVLILGRIDEAESYKGHQELVAAWADVVAAVPNARLLIGGGGSGLDGLRAQIAASPAAANIDVLGFIPEGEIENLWHRASVFAMPSRGEGFGLVYIEAMRHGLPVIASRHDAGQEVNVDGQTGFNVDLDAPGNLTARLIDLLANPALRQSMGEAGRQRWRQNFRFSAFKQRFLPLIERFAAN